MHGKWTTVFHGTTAAHGRLDPEGGHSTYDSALDRMLGIHVAKDPNIANSFTIGRGGTEHVVRDARIFELKLDESKYLTVPQPQYGEGPYAPYATDQTQIAKMIMGVAYRKDPSMLSRYLQTARAQPPDKAVSLANDLVAGKTVSMEGATITR